MDEPYDAWEDHRQHERIHQRRLEWGLSTGAAHWQRAVDLLDALGDVTGNVERAKVHAQLAAIAFDNPIDVAKAQELAGTGIPL